MVSTETPWAPWTVVAYPSSTEAATYPGGRVRVRPVRVCRTRSDPVGGGVLDGPAVAVLDPVGGAGAQPPVVVAGDDEVTDMSGVAVGQSHPRRRRRHRFRVG